MGFDDPGEDQRKNSALRERPTKRAPDDGNQNEIGLKVPEWVGVKERALEGDRGGDDENEEWGVEKTEEKVPHVGFGFTFRFFGAFGGTAGLGMAFGVPAAAAAASAFARSFSRSFSRATRATAAAFSRSSTSTR